MTQAGLSSLLFRVPTARLLISRVAGDLAERRSVLLLLPNGIGPDEIWHVLSDDLWRREVDFGEVWLPDARGGWTVASALGEKLGVKWPSPTASRTTANLVLAESLPDVIYLGGFAELPFEARRPWLDFVLQWAQEVKNAIDVGREPAALCLITPGWALPVADLPGRIHLSVRYWWGIPSALETRLICRLGSDDGRDSNTAVLWREHLLPSLCGSDAELVEWLWDDVYDGMDRLADRLSEFAKRRGWTAEILRGLVVDAWQGKEPDYVRPISPDPSYSALWAYGVLWYTQEYGVELHSAALALLGRVDEIRHRVWRGQAALLLPLIDELRVELCQHLTRLYGVDWVTRWQEPIDPREATEVRKSPLACQWGHLEHLLKNCPALRAHRSWLQAVALARSIRNRLAHYHPVDYGSYTALYREANRVREVL
jgi:hypothetical protein